MRFISKVFCGLAVLLSFNLAQATIIHVPGDSSTIQAGINGAVNGDTVLVAPGTYYEHINFLGKAILVRSEAGPAVTTIDRQDDRLPIVTFEFGEDSLSVFDGFTLVDGFRVEEIECKNGSNPKTVNLRMKPAYPIMRRDYPSTGKSQAPNQPGNEGLAMMADFENLPRPKYFITKQESSYDRNGGMFDYGHFLNGNITPQSLTCLGTPPRSELTECIMIDADGPGIVERFWHTSPVGYSAKIKFYMDNSDTPLVVTTRNELFDRDFLYPFSDLFVGNRFYSSGGYYCYFPIPFKQHIRITADSITSSQFWYNIDYSVFEDTADIISFSGTLNSEDEALYNQILSSWYNAGENPMDTSGALTLSQDVTLAPSDSQGMVLYGPGSVVSFKVRNFTSSDVDQSLKNIRLKIYWDGKTTPDVDIPLGAFFGEWFGLNPYQSIPLGYNAEGFYCYFPMPFRDSALVRFENQGTVTASFESEIKYKLVTGEDTLYQFHARWHKEEPTNSGIDYQFLDVGGEGHYVGTVLFIESNTPSVLEGDERFYVDDEMVPSIHGTGTEDYFNAGFYFENGEFALPYHGLIGWDKNNVTEWSMYRFNIPDVIPFTHHIKAGIEHGPMNDKNGNYYSVAFYYLNPKILCGDVNSDGIIDPGDVVYLINFLFRDGPAPHPQPAGEANDDGIVDVGDVIYLINYLFRGGPSPNC